jgi:putative membrane protein
MSHSYPKPEVTRNYRPLIIALTVIIYGGVALASYIPGVEQLRQFDLSNLPKLNAFVNSLNFVALIGALLAIKKKNLQLHKRFIYTAIGLTSVFLVSYLTYHLGSESTRYGGEGFLKGVYYFILITHIILAAAIVPIALTAIARGLNMEVERHRKIARWAMPIWLYVSMTGVIVYLMIAPYYGS